MHDIETIKNLFTNKNLTLSSAESYTGGLFASYMTSISGASKFFKGGAVTYYTEEKVRILDLNIEDLLKYGVVSSHTAVQMAFHCLEKFKTDYAVSFTGNAGPSNMENKPAGLVYICVCSNKKAICYEYRFEGARNEIREKSIDVAIELLKKILK